jgi:hypothetical protein
MDRAQAIPPKLTTSPPSRAVFGLAAAVLLGGILVLFRFNPSQYHFYPICQFHALTGLNCPGCGMLRATHYLLHGEVVTALRHNALLVLGLPVGVIWMACWVRGTRVSSPPPRPRNRTAVGIHDEDENEKEVPARRSIASAFKPSWIWWLLALALVFTIARNLPWRPFLWFSP